MTGNAEEARRRCCLTTKDFSILEAMLERRIASGDPILALLRQKLEDATVVSVLSVGADVVTLNSRVIFRVDAGEAETRTLVQQDARGPVGLNLPVSTMRGLSMLGMSEGNKVTVARPGGGQETILIEKVVYQPEAAKRAIAARVEPPLPAGRPALRLVHSAASDVQPLGEKWKMRQTRHDDDDPGPSAA
jgi:regulator of nucleoside diphosphate kinase